MFLSQYLLENYGEDHRVTALVNNTDLWLMPSLNPDGFAAGIEGQCDGMGNGGKGRANANMKDLNRDFPDLNQVVYDGAAENNHLLRVR